MPDARARQLRSAPTEAEHRLWQRLRGRRLGGFRFRRQHPLGAYIADFCCLSEKLVVEVDGGQHAWQRKRDEERDAWLEQQGFTVLRFWNHEVLENIAGVERRILEVLHAGNQAQRHRRGGTPRSERL